MNTEFIVKIEGKLILLYPFFYLYPIVKPNKQKSVILPKIGFLEWSGPLYNYDKGDYYIIIIP